MAATASMNTAADEVIATAIGSSDEVDKLPDTSGDDDDDVSAATTEFSGWLAADIVWVVVVAVSAAAAAESEVDVDSEVTATALLLDLLQPNTIMILLVFLLLLDK